MQPAHRRLIQRIARRIVAEHRAGVLEKSKEDRECSTKPDAVTEHAIPASAIQLEKRK